MNNQCGNCGMNLPGDAINDLCDECHDEIYNEEYAEDFRERAAEERDNELRLIAATCTCGAWQFDNRNKEVLHVADCCCGAE